MAESFPFYGNFNFLVEIEDLGGGGPSVVGGFAQVSGLGSESDVIEYRSGADPSTVKIPGRTRFANIVLRKGVTNSLDLYQWRKHVEEGQADVRSGSIVLLDSAMREKARWNFYGGWPSRYEGPLLDAQDSAVSVETLEIAVERLERVAV
jgi:phage tail-like protein